MKKIQKNKTKQRKHKKVTEGPPRAYLSRILDIWDTFHSTGYSGLRFWIFHVTNGTVFSGWLDQPVPGPHVKSFTPKYETNENKTNDGVFAVLTSKT